MDLEFRGARYVGFTTTDDRDGFILELRDQDLEPILEVFYSDQTHLMEFTAFRPNLPLEAVAWAIETAGKRLPSLDTRETQG